MELSKALKNSHDEVSWLALFDQEMTAQGLKDVLGALKTNKSLFHLDVGGNPIGDEGIEMMCNFLNGNKTVEHMYVWNTKMTDVGAKHVEKCLLKNRYVQIFDINDNPDVSLQMKATISALLKQGSSRVPASPRAFVGMKRPVMA